jgi:hypothetical protein
MTYYCAHADVENLIPTIVPAGGFSATTKPTETQVTGYCTQIDGEMRGVIEAAGYANDPTDTTAKAILTLYAAYGVAAMALLASRPLETEQAAAFRKLYEAGLERIRKGEVYGLAVTAASNAALPRSYYTSHPTDYPEARFKVGEEQW